MPNYEVNLKPVAGHSSPPLLKHFGEWLSSQEYGSLGWFTLRTERVPVEWDPDRIGNIEQHAFSFAHLPDGSSLLLVNRGASTPLGVGLLGSEGETDSVAASLEEFLFLLSSGQTGISDLDGGDAPARRGLKAWLRNNNITVPEAASSAFDFDNFLDGSVEGEVAIPEPAASSHEGMTALPPFFRQVAIMVGRRADDAELVEFVTGTLGQKIPNSTTDAAKTKNVVAKKHGLELLFSHDVKNMKYPPVRKSKASYLPYLTLVWLNPELPEALPFGLRFSMSIEEIAGALGEPSGQIGSQSLRRPYWQRVLDPTRDIVFQMDLKTLTVQISQARELAAPSASRPLVGLLVAWLAQRRLLEPTALGEHVVLLDAVARREQRGSTLVDAALPRGLWDSHLKDLPGLRHFAFEWMHNIGGKFVRDDLVSVFGARKGPYGHDEAAFDDDDWPAVDRAAAVLDGRFAEWCSPSVSLRSGSRS